LNAYLTGSERPTGSSRMADFEKKKSIMTASAFQSTYPIRIEKAFVSLFVILSQKRYSLESQNCSEFLKVTVYWLLTRYP